MQRKYTQISSSQPDEAHPQAASSVVVESMPQLRPRHAVSSYHNFNHHSNPSNYYYICFFYAALVCLSHLGNHQLVNRATAMTIIIDGATTNEWATQDEYQRLVDSAIAREAAQASAADSTSSSSSSIPFPSSPNSDQQQQTSQQNRQQQLQTQQLQQLQQLQLQLQQLQQLRQLEQMQEQTQLQQLQVPISSPIISSPIISSPAGAAGAGAGHSHAAAISNPSAGAKSIQDLVPLGDGDSAGGDSDEQGVAESLSKLGRRASAPQKYCGDKLHEMLYLVCHGRFFEEPIIQVDPIIKTKRFVAGSSGSGASSSGATGNGNGSGAKSINNDNIRSNNRNRHSKMSLYRRIRGASAECCERQCTHQDLEKYCARKSDG